jgi:RsmE family RNA methyltransferase
MSNLKTIIQSKMTYIFYPNYKLNEALQGDAAAHLFSMRPEIGEVLNLVDFQGWRHEICITACNKKERYYETKHNSSEFKARKDNQHILIIGITSKEYQEKLFEILPFCCFNKVIMYQSDHSQLGVESVKLDRLNKILQRSGEQSQRLYLPKIELWKKQEVEKIIIEKRMSKSQIFTLSITEMYNSEFLFDSINPSLSSYFFVGPEGGFSNRENKLLKDTQKINLGSIVYPAWLCPMALSDYLSLKR